ncbi:MAG: T9SS type A sorting domain-containing protein [Bacteroidales bacterium]|nr:T9SS type A sorting domain-containing protein [Bacteroidales bacterium]
MFDKRFSILVFLFVILCSAAIDATNYYSDPSASGNMKNDGSATNPWSGLSDIFTSIKTFQTGDTIFLRTGNHGYAVIKGFNTGFVVITPEAGQKPVLTRVGVSSASFWKLYKLTVQSESSGTLLKGDYPLVELFGNASDITVSSCKIQSNDNTINWTRDDWRKRCNWGISTRDRLNSNFIIEDNSIKNVSIGLSISSSNCKVRRNTVQYFTNDGSRVIGSDILFEKNKVMDLMKVMTVAENHDDLFQSFVYAAGGPGQQILRNDTISGNLFLATSDTNRPFVGSIQGMGCFDGPFENWVVENNIVMPDSWHGISFYFASNCKIINNTVLDPYPVTPVDPYDNNKSSIGPAWIYLDGASTNNIVKNNLANKMNFASGVNTTAASNYVVASTSSVFVDVSNVSAPGTYDLHLVKGSLPVDRGDNVDAPSVDFDGNPRPIGSNVDVGAYEFNPNLSAERLISDSKKIRIYPNPFHGELNVDLGNNYSTSVNVDILNLNGQFIFNQKIETNSSILQIKNLVDLACGIYFLKLTDNKGKFSFAKISKVN